MSFNVLHDAALNQLFREARTVHAWHFLRLHKFCKCIPLTPLKARKQAGFFFR